MGALSKQWKIWRDDFLRYYGRTSLITRIVIGAALAFGVAYVSLNYVIRPERAKIREVSGKLDNMDIVPDVELMMQDLKNRSRRVSAQLAAIQQQNREFGERNGGLSRGEVGKTLLELRRLMDVNRIRILSESRLVVQPPKRATRSTGGNTAPETRLRLILPDSMEGESFAFRLLGSFQDIRNFLHDAYSSEAVFYLNNIAIGKSDELMTDREFRQYKALECSFELHIPYLKGN